MRVFWWKHLNNYVVTYLCFLVPFMCICHYLCFLRKLWNQPSSNIGRHTTLLCTKLIQSDSACLASIRTQLLFWCQEMAAYLFKFQPKTLYRFRISSCTPAFSAGLQYSAIQTVGKLRIATLCTSGLYKKVSTTVICDVSLCHLTKLLKCIYQYVCYEYVCIAARASTTSATLS